jgi:hypothetical protein
VKCDRRRPSCGPCSRNEKPCEYKKRKQPGLRAGYGKEIEARQEKIEERVTKLERGNQELARQVEELAGIFQRPPQSIVLLYDVGVELTHRGDTTAPGVLCQVLCGLREIWPIAGDYADRLQGMVERRDGNKLPGSASMPAKKMQYLPQTAPSHVDMASVMLPHWSAGTESCWGSVTNYVDSEPLDLFCSANPVE